MSKKKNKHKKFMEKKLDWDNLPRPMDKKEIKKLFKRILKEYRVYFNKSLEHSGYENIEEIYAEINKAAKLASDTEDRYIEGLRIEGEPVDWDDEK